MENKDTINQRWSYFSDHLFIGTEIEFKNKETIKVGTNNILNKHYIDWIYKNGQGLNDSFITKTEKGNIRKEIIMNYIRSWFNDYKLDILNLQEVSSDIKDELQKFKDYELISFDNDEDYQCILFNKNTLRHIKTKIVTYQGSGNRIIIADLETKKNKITMICTHVPWGKFQQLTDYVLKDAKFDKDSNVIIAGDFNTDKIPRDLFIPLVEELTHVTNNFKGKDAAVQYDWIVSHVQYRRSINKVKKIDPEEMGLGSEYYTILHELKNGKILINQSF